MRQISIKQLRMAPGKELEDLPFAITMRGKPIAKCTPYIECTPEAKKETLKCTPTPKCTPKKIIKTVDDATEFVGYICGQPVYRDKPKKAKK